ncbi:MAG: hypothetical protein K0R03_441 [Moraxellaceae bacterium]|jgi:hypothetical protein|nr:hypothetical protein [Moraxellaceae bacterium]
MLKRAMIWRAYLLGLAFMMIAAGPAVAIEEMDDESLAGVSGQSLFTSNTTTNGAFTYYRIGIDAEILLNTNINRLALGCDGAAGTGICDIDLSRARFAGVSASSTTDSGPATDFLLRRPYIEFAVKNAGTAASRELSGFRVGAVETLGMLSIGENPNINDLNDDTGIQRLTGFMTATLTNTRLTDVGVTTFGACCVVGPTTATVSSHTQAVTLRRSTTATFSRMTATASGITLNNVWLNNEPLDNVHNILVAGNATGTTPTRDFYISNQKETLAWQSISTGLFNGCINTTKDGCVAIPAAEKGWWMYLPQVQLPNITSNQTVRVSTLEAVGGIFGGQVDINPVDLQQLPVDNCYGNLRFC